MTETRVRDLVGLAVAVAIGVWFVVRVSYGSLPPIPLLAGVSLVVVAVAEAVVAYWIRGRISDRQVGDGLRQLHPITAARALAVAKASSLVGAAVAGAWVGFLAHVVPQRSTVRAAAEDTPGALVGAVAAVLLVGAALWLERSCRTPRDDRGDDRGDDAGRMR